MATERINTLTVKLLLLFALVFSGYRNAFSQVSSDYDHHANFSQYKTYGFKPGVSYNQGQVDKNNTLLDQKVDNSVAGQLNAKGLQQSSNNPDLIVTYTAGVQQKSEIENMGPVYAGPGYYGGYYGAGGWWSGSWNNWWVNTYDEGTLIIDVIDSKTNKLVYRVYGAGEVKKPEKRQKQIDKITEKGFKDYPHI